MSIKNLITKYQKAFNQHDLNKLSDLFDNKIRLKDWGNDIKGKKKVLKSNLKLFESIKNIKCIPLQTIIQEKVAVCEIIVVAKKSRINVVDIIKFNNNKKIISIKAFKI
jgi:hypothetical protein